MVIRQIEMAQISDAVEVIRQSFRTVADDFGLTPENCPSHPAFLSEEQLSARVAGGLRIFGYFAENTLAGVVGIKQEDTLAFAIEKLAVLPEYRHRHFGTRLMYFAWEQIRQSGGEQACIGIIDENTVLKQWYQRQGFIVTDVKRFPHLPFTVCLMKKALCRTAANAICIIGSPAANGSTVQVVEHIIAGLADAGIESEAYLLHDMNIAFCRGCKACEATAQCVQRDDMDILTAALLAADIVLLASPSYWGDITAQLKTFIDRCTPLCDTRPGGTMVPSGKRGIAVAIRAGQSKGENQHLLATMHHFFSHLGITPVAEYYP